MDKIVKVRVTIPYTDIKLQRDVRKGELLEITPKRMLEIMDVEKDKNVEIFSIVSIERGALDE
jgi:hypothetical protein